MPDDLVVHLNRDGPHSIGVEPRQFVAGGSFDVVLRNHGTALHVHLHLDDDLSAEATLGTANHFVEEGAVRRVRVTVDEPLQPVEGRLKLVTGYGSETEYVRIALEDVEPEERHVRVDEALGQPTPAPVDDEPLLAAGDLPTLALGAVAVLVALVAAVLIGGPASGLGLAVVLVGVLVGWAVLRG
ncbi:MAG: hypothetical protein U5J98_11255 [Halobacteriales archaeon]|nr:hypothetical protein [Halobacteriales archaeon]